MQSSGKIILGALLPLLCHAHWRLVKPVPRSAGAYENNPLPPDANTAEEWVCRNANPSPKVQRPTIAAGESTSIEYGTGAVGHAGDCAVYISYDTARSRRTMRWVKIANLPDCKSQINQLVNIDVPSELPAGDAVLRWDQYALHQGTFIEWFIQCADIKISSASERSWESFNSFSMIDNDGTPAYPSDVSRYRSPYKPNQAAPGDSEFWMTGPACVDDSLNNCALTAAGTKGNTGFGGEHNTGSSAPASPAPVSPSVSASPASTPSVQYPTSAATRGSSTPVGDPMCCYDASCSTYGTSFCNLVGSWCSGSKEACESCGGTLCTDTGGSYSAPVPSHHDVEPEPEPEPKPETPALSPSSATTAGGAQCCYHAGCPATADHCNPVGAWCSESAEHCATCGGTLCAGMSMLSEAHAARRAKFLHRPGQSGHILMQTSTAFKNMSSERSEL